VAKSVVSAPKALTTGTGVYRVYFVWPLLVRCLTFWRV